MDYSDSKEKQPESREQRINKLPTFLEFAELDVDQQREQLLNVMRLLKEHDERQEDL